jgi:hypothetical protein
MFRSVEVADPLRTKQLRAGLTQLGEEGAIQVFRPVAGSVLLLGAVGQLQFEVVAHRLEHEYGVKARVLPSRFQVARWVTCEPEDGGDKELQRFIDANQHRVAYDAVDAPTVLVEYAPELRAIESNWPKIRFTPCASTPASCSSASSRAEQPRCARTPWPTCCECCTMTKARERTASRIGRGRRRRAHSRARRSGYLFGAGPLPAERSDAPDSGVPDRAARPRLPERNRLPD